jgi:hypothetical protein
MLTDELPHRTCPHTDTSKEIPSRFGLETHLDLKTFALQLLSRLQASKLMYIQVLLERLMIQPIPTKTEGLEFRRSL